MKLIKLMFSPAVLWISEVTTERCTQNYLGFGEMFPKQIELYLTDHRDRGQANMMHVLTEKPCLHGSEMLLSPMCSYSSQNSFHFCLETLF